MAKKSYKIPTSLDRTFLDQEISLSGGGWQPPPWPIKVILFWLVSVLVLFWLTTSTFVKSADWWLVTLLVIWWLAATAFFGKYGKTKEMNFMTVPALLEYVPTTSRRVVTRSRSNPSNFYSIFGIRSVDETGFITYLDDTVGQAYLVVGSASILVFDDDKRAILDRTDAFWRNVDPDIEFITVTTKEPQRVYRHLANVEKRNQALEVRDPELFDLLDEDFWILKNYVGKEFNSIHQYMLLKADNKDALRRGHRLLSSEVEGSSLMIKQCTMLGRDDLYEMLRSVYTADR